MTQKRRNRAATADPAPSSTPLECDKPTAVSAIRVLPQESHADLGLPDDLDGMGPVCRAKAGAE